MDDEESPRARLVSLPMWVYRHRVPILAGFGGMLLAGVLALGYFTTRVVARFDGQRWNLPSRIYSDLYALRPGDAAAIPGITAKLGRLFYQEIDGPPERPGHFRREKDALEIYTRGFRYPGRTFPGARMRVVFASGRVKSLTDAAGDPVPALILEPELLGSVFGADLEDRTVIRLAQAPQSLVDAILVTEDRDFFRHTGVSVRRLFGAVFRTLTGGMKQGGSTLTQQLVKNLYLSPERTVRRKAMEAVMAVVLDARYSKDEILEAYLNEIYLGRRGAIAVTGVGEAARYYFGTEVSDLDLAQSATLAGMIRAPNAYSPFRNPERARQRRDLVLRLMREEGKIDEAALKAAVAEPVTPRSRVEDRTRAPHFVDFVKGELAERYGQQLQTEGLQIYTTLDVDLQQAGQRAVTQGLENLEKTYRRLASASKEAPLQGALIVLEPQTGGVRALVGARDYRLSQFNRVTQAHRQPGSLFKPFVYLAAFARRDMDPPVTPATILMDSPITVEWGQKTDEESLDAAQLRRRLPRADVGAPGARAFDQHPDRARLADGGPSVRPRRGQGRGHRVAAARVPVGRARRLRDLADGDRGRVLGLRQQRRARGAECDRGRHDGRRDRARPQGRAAVPGAAGRRGLPRQHDPEGGGGPRHGHGGALEGPDGRARGQDRHDERRARRLVRGLLAAIPRGRLGRLRRQPRPESLRARRRPCRSSPTFRARRPRSSSRGLPGALRHRDGDDRSRDGIPRVARLPAADDGGLHRGHGADDGVPEARGLSRPPPPV